MNEKVVVPALMRVITANRPCVVVSGGADGADRLWARAAYKTKTPYEIWVPAGYYEHYNLSKEWTTPMLWAAEHVEHIGGMGAEFDVVNNFVRNVAMIETADAYVVCSHKHPIELVKQKRGGTAHCTRELIKRRLPIIWINSETGERENYIP